MEHSGSCFLKFNLRVHQDSHIWLYVDVAHSLAAVNKQPIRCHNPLSSDEYLDFQFFPVINNATMNLLSTHRLVTDYTNEFPRLLRT